MLCGLKHLGRSLRLALSCWGNMFPGVELLVIQLEASKSALPQPMPLRSAPSVHMRLAKLGKPGP